MKSLSKIIGELVIAGLCGTAIGGAIGHTVEAVREGIYESKRAKNPQVFACKYEINRRVIYGTGVIGGILAVVIYMKRGDEDEAEEEKDGGKGL